MNEIDKEYYSRLYDFFNDELYGERILLVKDLTVDPAKFFLHLKFYIENRPRGARIVEVSQDFQKLRINKKISGLAEDIITRFGLESIHNKFLVHGR